MKLTETKLGVSSTPKSWGIDSDTLLEQYELNGASGLSPATHAGRAVGMRTNARMGFFALLLVVVTIAAGDTVGVAFDQSDEKVLRIYHNGQYLSDQDVRGMKGETWPIIIVAGGATLEVRCLPPRSPADHAVGRVILRVVCCLWTDLPLVGCCLAVVRSSTLGPLSSLIPYHGCSMVSWRQDPWCKQCKDTVVALRPQVLVIELPLEESVARCSARCPGR